LGKKPILSTENAPAREPGIARDLNRRVAWRAWAEPHVRLWWVTTLVVLAAGIYVGTLQLSDWYTEARLIRRGTPAVATVESVNEKATKGNSQPGDSPVVLRFDWQGQSATARGHLAGRPASNFIKVGEKVNILVDPANPDPLWFNEAFWTSRQGPAPLSSVLGVPILVILAAAVVGAASWELRRRALRSYRFGDRASARVISRFRSALSPQLWTVRCVLIDGDDKKVFSVYVPSRFPSQPGETVEVILPPPSGGMFRPLAAAWFE